MKKRGLKRYYRNLFKKNLTYLIKMKYHTKFLIYQTNMVQKIFLQNMLLQCQIYSSTSVFNLKTYVSFVLLRLLYPLLEFHTYSE